MSVEENKSIVRRFDHEVRDKGDVAAADDVFAAKFVDYNPSFGLPGNREGFKHYVTTLRHKFGYHPTLDELTAEGDKAVASLTWRGRPKLRIVSITFIDREFAELAIIIWRIADGKIVERWSTWEARQGEPRICHVGCPT
jgi:predicted SnoaL-like aldol condensation-catalyzing enzyme